MTRAALFSALLSAIFPATLILDTAMLSVALLFYAVRLSAGEGRGMPSTLAGLGLLPVAALTLRSRYTGKPSR
jgi:hypothetical protein